MLAVAVSAPSSCLVLQQPLLARQAAAVADEAAIAPATFLRAGRNEVVVLDLLKTDAAPLRGAATLK